MVQFNDVDIYGDVKYLEHSKYFDQNEASAIVYVNSVKNNMEKLALSIVNHNSIYIEGSLGCGKTALVHYLAKITSNKLIKYQMDDYMDSKAMIGSYVCSDVPGEFLWKPGPLYEAANNGYWLLLEDIDYASVDSISLLIDLLETGCIKTNEAFIKIHSNFRMFLTQRTHGDRLNNLNYLESIHKLSRTIKFEELTDSDILEIICQKYKNLDVVSSKLLDIFKYLNENQIDPKAKALIKRDSRVLSLRDLLKLCNRLKFINNYETHTKVLNILQDMYDCFLAFLSNKAIRNSICVEIGTFFNINKDVVNAFLGTHKANLENKMNEVMCGRVKLLKSQSFQPNIGENEDVFVQTRVASNLLEQISRCIECNEPVLLCGETGVGKTTVLQYLAKLLGKNLIVINLNQQTETSDLIGSFKPIDAKYKLKEFKDTLETLFQQTFSLNENKEFLSHIHTFYTQNNWNYFIRLAKHSIDSAIKKLKQINDKSSLNKKWMKLKSSIRKIEEHIEHTSNKLTFKFFEGALTKSIQNGDWVILDEINLASSETLQFLGTLLDGDNSSIVLYEKGDNEPIKRNKSFRLFAAMNPASDIGKKNLPLSIRSRFTEIYVDELEDKSDIYLIIRSYLNVLNPSSHLINTIVDLYLDIKLKVISQLINGVGLPPIFSLRTLCRALRYASKNPCNNCLLSIYDGMCLSFLTDLNRQSSLVLENHIKQRLLSSNKSLSPLTIQRSVPTISGFKKTDFLKVDEFWILKGEKESKLSEAFIMTETVKENLKRLARVCSSRLPCLIQGDTSIGKTSLIKWLANVTGNKLIRINNHENTDLQEYIGSYITNNEGKLEFKEGLLVEAMRKGYWILLDELNLATSEVLEALNRVLDDNRELFIPEVQETVKAHPRFILFATQNPAGKYSGRKQLSRAFRNRFIELHFDELPLNELCEIVEQKCRIPSTYSNLLIQTVFELRTHRSQYNGIFAGKNSLITLRDLFRWADRYSKLDDRVNCDDWKQYLAEQGFLMLSGRCRSNDDVKTIHECIEKVFKKQIDINNLNDPKTLCQPIMEVLQEIESYASVNVKNFVWTKNSRRLALLVGLAYKFDEPFLLVGDTGLGKTTVCQLLSNINNKYLHIVNCHMHSEASDFLGNIRPVRDLLNDTNNKLFEWQDGPLLVAVKNGEDFLIDEISLADDSVLERLNSLLESERTLLVTENNFSTTDSLSAHPSFRICATMNPSGDFGKKELSPALRNRFLEIWCPTISTMNEFELILNQNLKITDFEVKHMSINIIIQFLEWLKQQTFFRNCITLRDINLWIDFINKTQNINMHPYLCVIHGACLVFIDSLSTDNHIETRKSAREICLDYLFKLIQSNLDSNFSILNEYNESLNQYFQLNNQATLHNYTFNAPTTKLNLTRIMRCMFMDTPIMLEGSPGVGKTTIVQVLGKVTKNTVIRINLSEQTDLSELFGNDLPSMNETSQKQYFEWRDGPFLHALKQGYWIVLDELNLASQSVLEGLNSCFDHRGEIFISELGRKFIVNKSSTKIFACQNPYKQGGGRKGLPKSFLNRFSKVYIEEMKKTDLVFITKMIYSQIDENIIEKIIEFNEKLNNEVCVQKKWGSLGGPWEFNLRDIFRLCDLIVNEQSNGELMDPGRFINLIYASRFRTLQDRENVFRLFKDVFNYDAYKQENITDCVYFANTHIQIGTSVYLYNEQNNNQPIKCNQNRFAFTNANLKYSESVLKCIQMNWMCVLVGQTCTGKTSLIRLLASLCGQSLIETSVTNSTDTSDLLGTFAKIYLQHDIYSLLNKIKSSFYQKLQSCILNKEEFQYSCKKIFEIDQLLNEEKTKESVEVVNFDDIKLLINYIDKILDKKNEYLLNLYHNLKKKFDIENLALKQSIKFDWLDSSLVNAIKNGDWLLIDNANFCNPSVLDRLNPLLEPNGSLIITEKGCLNGQLNEIKAHKNFRLFLCVNETFGELSRAMRNRGVEIYLDPVQLFNADSVTLVDHVFTQAQKESKEFSINYLINIFSNLQQTNQRFNFKEVLKLTKLISDYWMFYKNTSFIDAVEKTLNEMGFKISGDVFNDNNNNTQIYSKTAYSNVYKFIKYPIYQHLNKFKYFDKLLKSTSFNTSNLMDSHIYTTLVQMWFERIPLKHRYLIFNYAMDYLPFELKHLYEEFFCLNEQSAHNSQLFLRLIESLNIFGNSIDVYEQSFNISTNKELLNKLAVLNKENCQNVLDITSSLSVQLVFYLSKLRLSTYKVEFDSLERMNQAEINQDFNVNINLIEEFFKAFYEHQSNSQFRLDDKYVSMRINLIIIEKFLILIKTSFDVNKTIAYLKYYWNLIRKSIGFFKTNDLLLRNIHQINCFLNFDDTYYNIYLNYWKSFTNKINFIINDSNNKECELINNFLLNLGSVKLYKNLKNLIVFINYYEDHDSTLHSREEKRNYIIDNIDNLIKVTNQDIDFKRSQLYCVKYQYLPIKLYFDKLKALQNNGNCVEVPTSLIELQCMDTAFTYLYRLYMDTCFNLNAFITLKQILLLNEENVGELLTKSDFNDINLNLLQYNWYFEYINKMVCDLNFRNVNLINLNNYNESMFSLNSLIKTVWTNKSLFSVSFDKCLDEFYEKTYLTFNEVFINQYDYLIHKGFDNRFYELNNNSNQFYKFAIIGLQISFFYLPMDPLDPHVYDCLNEQNNDDVIKIFENELNTYIKSNGSETDKYILDSYVHKQIQTYLNNNKQTDKSITLIQRDLNPSYYEIKREFEHILKNLCSFNNISKFILQFESNSRNNYTEQEYKTWYLTINNFISYVSKKYYYSDIIYPVISGIALLAFSLNSLYTKWHLNLKLNENVKTFNFIETLFKFPILNEKNLIEYAKLFNSNIEITNNIYLISLINLYNEGKSANDKCLIEILNHFSTMYQSNLDSQAKDQLNTYEYKKYGKSEADEWDENEEISFIFPTYLNEFHQFEFIAENFGKKLQNNNSQQVKKENSKIFQQVFYLIKLFFTHINDECVELIILKEFFESYKLASFLMQMNSLQFKNDSEHDFNISHLLFVCILKKFDKNFQLNNNEFNLTQTYNIYADSNYTEVIKCKIVLDEFNTRTNNLLNEFPDNSILLELNQIQRRIETFSINDTVIKYLTGLELLIKKAQNWQLISAKQYSLDAELKLINDLIIEWRKIELNYWKVLLNVELECIENNSGYKWFFHVYTVCLKFQNENYSDVFSALTQFMNTSSIGEYKLRLNILKMCYKLFNKQQVSNILWNIYKYYELFEKVVENEINKCKNSIENELNGYISICRWQDMNFWGLKQTVDKTHKMLYKFIKKFREFLQDDCSKHLTLTNINKTTDFIHINEKDEPFCNIEIKLPEQNKKLIVKMEKFAKRLLNIEEKRNFLNSVTSFSLAVNERFYEMKDLTKFLFKSNKNTKELKEAYNKSIKNLQLQKSKALDDLFSVLKFIGLSYRKGNIEFSKVNEKLADILVFQEISNDKIKFWTSNESMYYVVLTRYIEYKNASTTKNDTKKVKFEQLNGYIEHFFHVVNKQKINIHKFYEHFNEYTKLNKTLKHLNNANCTISENKCILTEILNLRNKLSKASIQLNIFIKHINKEFENDDNGCLNLIQNIMNLINISLDKIKNFIHLFSFNFSDDINSNKENILKHQNSLFNQNLEELEHDLRLVYSHFEAFNDKLKSFNEIYMVFNGIKRSIMNFIDFSNNKEVIFFKTENNEEDVLSGIIIKRILKVIELFYKKYYVNNESTDTTLDLFGFSQNSFINLCYKDFSDDLIHTDLKRLNRKINLYLKNFKPTNSTTLLYNYCKIYEIFLQNWFEVSCEFHLRACECFNTLINVFTEVKINGFCKPDDVDMEDIEPTDTNEDRNNEKFNLNDDPCGIGEGEGQKNVSDQIENEDQLDETKQQDEKCEENEEKEKVKEEKNGIEMSDDFDGDLEDVEMQEENSDDEKDDADHKEDVDDQKGDVDEDQDILDDRLWGDENEDESEEKKKNEIESDKGGQLEEKGKDEYGAIQDELDSADKLDKLDEKNEEMKEDDENIEEVNDDFNEDDSNDDVRKEKMEKKPDMDENKAEEPGLDVDENIENPNKGSDSDEDDDNVSITNNEHKNEVVEIEDDEGDEQNDDCNKNASETKDYEKNNQNQTNRTDKNQGFEEANSQENAEFDNNDNNDSDTLMDTTDTKSTNTGSKFNQSIPNQNQKLTQENKRIKIHDKQNDNRILGDENKLALRDEKIIDADDESNIANDDRSQEEIGNEFKHIKDENENFDKQLPDTASHAHKQKIEIIDDNKDKNVSEDTEINEEKVELRNSSEIKSGHNKNNETNKDQKLEKDELIDLLEKTQIRETMDRDDVEQIGSLFETNLTEYNLAQKFRLQIENKLDVLRQKSKDNEITLESIELWHAYEVLTQQLSKELCEHLRLILEPTKCSKLKGDYKTGKRLNMKRVVEYIATEYRKDKIWLRRTQPSNRNYQILLAVDNSSSMADNHCMQLAYETIATLTNAFNYLQVGQFGLLSFGKDVTMLHELNEPFNSDMGAKVFSQLNFNDTKTCVAQMLNFINEIFDLNKIQNSDAGQNTVSKLLIVLSDGRGIFYEGIDLVKKSVQKCLQEKVFVVFIILDIPGKASVFDIRMSMTADDNKLKLVSYMEQFPFPFYIVLRDINNLPIVMIEALKQWFDLVTKIN